MNVNNVLLSKERIESSRGYIPLRNFSTKIFPLFDNVREQVKAMTAKPVEDQIANDASDE